MFWAEASRTPKMEGGVSGLTKFGFYEPPIRWKLHRKFSIAIEGRRKSQPKVVGTILCTTAIPMRNFGVRGIQALGINRSFCADSLLNTHIHKIPDCCPNIAFRERATSDPLVMSYKLYLLWVSRLYRQKKLSSHLPGTTIIVQQANGKRRLCPRMSSGDCLIVE